MPLNFQIKTRAKVGTEMVGSLDEGGGDLWLQCCMVKQWDDKDSWLSRARAYYLPSIEMLNINMGVTGARYDPAVKIAYPTQVEVVERALITSFFLEILYINASQRA